MNAVIQAEPVSAATLEHVIGTGDLSKLSTPQRVEYYRRTCESLGVNPLTRPFRFLSLNGQIMLYATRDLTDQLRKRDQVKITIVDKAIDGDLFIVTARAMLPDGRMDEDVGAVTIGRLQGEARANAVMKAITKAKRRVTLSICGQGFTDESELDGMPGVKTFDPDETPPAPIRAAAAAIAKEERIAKLAPTYDAREPTAKSPPSERTEMQWQSWIERLHNAAAVCTSRDTVAEIGGRPSVKDALENAPEWVRRDITDLLTDAYSRHPEADVVVDLEADWPGPDPEKAQA